MTLDEILELVGTFDASPGESTARDRFRVHLAKSVTTATKPGHHLMRHLGGALLVTAVFLTACATAPPLKVPSTQTVREDESARYTRDLRERIKKFWPYPCVQVTENNCEYKRAELDVEIGLLESGELHSVKVVRSSGIALYDSYVVNAIRLASPYPPVPATMVARRKHEPDAPSTAGLRAGAPMPAIRFAARFKYVVEGSKVE